MASQLSRKILSLAVLGITVLVVASAVSALGLLSNNARARAHGAVETVNVGAYWNSGCTNATTDINFGTVSPGSVSNVSFYVRNEGKLLLKLSLSTQNWNPTSASFYMTLSWDKEGKTLAAGNVTLATLTLNVSESISGVQNFSFDIVISGTDQ